MRIINSTLYIKITSQKFKLYMYTTYTFYLFLLLYICLFSSFRPLILFIFLLITFSSSQLKYSTHILSLDGLNSFLVLTGILFPSLALFQEGWYRANLFEDKVNIQTDYFHF